MIKTTRGRRRRSEGVGKEEESAAEAKEEESGAYAQWRRRSTA